jgi:Na+/melibiose symporter-like transporter
MGQETDSTALASLASEQAAVRQPGVRLKLGYGSGNAGLQCIVHATTYYLLIFYTDVVGLAPMLAAVAMALPRFWDAVSDPLMGVISDRSRFAGGRRRPYIFWGAPFLCLFFVMLWYPFPGGGATLKFAYLLAVNLAFTTAITVVGVP